MLRDVVLFTPEGSAKAHFSVSAQAMRLYQDLMLPVMNSRRVYLRTLQRFYYVHGAGQPGDVANGKRWCRWQDFNDGLFLPRRSYFMVEGERVALWQLGANYMLDNTHDGGRLMTHLRFHQGPWLVRHADREWFAECLQSAASWYCNSTEWVTRFARFAKQSSDDLLIIPAVGPHHCRDVFQLPVKAGLWGPSAASGQDLEDLPPALQHELMIGAARATTRGWQPIEMLSPTALLKKRYTRHTLQEALKGRSER